ncbi:MAG: TonB family protein [Bacteroidia bacterium]|nr:TonB family protein [Bacteroidia bacterium]
MKQFSVKLIYLFLLSFGCETALFAQAGKALELNNEAKKAFGKKRYRAADSLYTLSLNLKETEEAYLNRAACRHQLNDKKGSCMDLYTAAGMGSKEGLVLFREQCSKSDTLYKSSDNKIADKTNYAFKEAVETCELIGSYDYIKYNVKNEIVLSYYAIGKDTIYRQGTEMTMPEFPGGGFKEMRNFINNRMQYPVQARENGISGKVWVIFTVSKTGKIEKPIVYIGMKDCEECNAEALRVVSLMPTWIPAKYKGKTVTSSFRAPFNFKVN